MNTPSISLKRTLDVTMKDAFRRIKELGMEDRQALREEYNEWLELVIAKINTLMFYI